MIILCFTTNYEIRKYGKKVKKIFIDIYKKDLIYIPSNPIKKVNSFSTEPPLNELKTDYSQSRNKILMINHYNSSTRELNDYSYQNQIKSKLTFNDFEMNYNSKTQNNNNNEIYDKKMTCFSIFY